MLNFSKGMKKFSWTSVTFSRLFSGFLFVLTLFSFSPLAAQKAVPELWGLRVHDEAKVLSQSVVEQLEQKLKKYEDSTSNQIAILIINSLDGDAPEEYSMRVVEKWKLGNKKKDNGVLLLIASDDHKMRIEVGQGLEGVLTDAKSNGIIRNEIAPNLRRGDYDAGVTAGVGAIIGTIAGEYKSDVVDSGSSQMSVTELIITGLFIFGILGLFTMIALFSGGCAGWGLYAFLLPFYAIFPSVVLGTSAGIDLLIFYAVAVPIVKIIVGRTAWGKSMMMKSKPGSSSGSGGGWSLGSGWGSSGGFSGGGGGGFSGGGGSFGGGGSSGSW